jgi:5-methylcytosine-specific restriction endonuclease McrA
VILVRWKESLTPEERLLAALFGGLYVGEGQASSAELLEQEESCLWAQMKVMAHMIRLRIGGSIGQLHSCETFKGDFEAMAALRFYASEAGRLWHMRHPERSEVQSREWYTLNLEYARAQSAAYYKAHATECIARTREWYRTHPEYYTSHRERYAQWHHKWYTANSEKAKALVRSWRRKHPEKGLEAVHRYRARLISAEGNFSIEEFDKLREEAGYECVYCGRSEGEIGKLVADHAIPLSRGGSNFIDNIVPICLSCNSSKGDKTIEEYLEWLEQLDKVG